MKRSYQDKLHNINLWVEIINYHWDRLQGELYNDPEFWDHTLHAMATEDWWDWVDIEPALRAQYPDAFQKYSYCKQATEEINKKLMLGKDIAKKGRVGKNFEAFRALMNIKDVVNHINGTPTRLFPKKPEVTVEDAKPASKFFDLFQLGA